MTETVPHFPGRAPIDAYGNGGFRFADMSHKGSILILPSGIYGWAPQCLDALTVQDFAQVFEERGRISFILLGCGEVMARPPEEVADTFRREGIGLEFMDTGAAARTYNVLLGEGRAVAGALIAVDEPV